MKRRSLTRGFFREVKSLHYATIKKKINAWPFTVVLTKTFQPALRKYQNKCTKLNFISLNVV
jgi:hypothetical protein